MVGDVACMLRGMFLWYITLRMWCCCPIISGLYVLLSGSRICMFVVVCNDSGIRFLLFSVVDIAAPESAMYSLRGDVGSEHVLKFCIVLALAVFVFLFIVCTLLYLANIVLVVLFLPVSYLFSSIILSAASSSLFVSWSSVAWFVIVRVPTAAILWHASSTGMRFPSFPFVL